MKHFKREDIARWKRRDEFEEAQQIAPPPAVLAESKREQAETDRRRQERRGAIEADAKAQQEWRARLAQADAAKAQQIDATAPKMGSLLGIVS